MLAAKWQLFPGLHGPAALALFDAGRRCIFATFLTSLDRFF
jgi:hypothetical protein